MSYTKYRTDWRDEADPDNPLPGATSLDAAFLDQVETALDTQDDRITVLENRVIQAPTGVAATDRANIQTALDGVAAGGRCQLQPGTYLTEQTIRLPNHVTLVGTATQERTTFGSIIKAANGSNLDAVIADKQWYDNASATGDYKALIDLQVDGNAANQTSGMGIGVVGMSYKFYAENVAVANTRGDGIRLTNVNRAGTEVTGTPVENQLLNCRVQNPGLANLANNNDGIAIREGVGGNAVTDAWIINCAVWSDTGSSNGHGMFLGQSAGSLISGCHIYSVGKDGMHILNTGFTRVTDNYCELYGQKASVGAVRGIYVKESGSGGTVLSNNTFNLNQGISGNTHYGLYLENNPSAAAYFALGPNIYYTTTSSSGTGLRAVNNGSNSNFKLAYSAQTYNGMLINSLIDNYVNVQGEIGGYQNPVFTATYTPDPSKGTKIEMTLTGNVTINLPTMFPSGMRLTFMFLQDASGGRTVTFNSSQYRFANWTPDTSANKVNTIMFESQGFWLYQIGAGSG